MLEILTPSTDTLILLGMGAVMYVLGRILFKD